ncbi:MAG: PAS domain-containing hybrid sensor histidine kinase/response regulator, partial [Planctomycetota bacterium]
MAQDINATDNGGVAVAEAVVASTFAQEGPAGHWGFIQAIIDGLDARVAILDDHADIVMVNRAWLEFAEAAHLGLPEGGVGTNYLAVCRKSEADGAPGAREARVAIEALLARRSDGGNVEYECPAPDEQFWFKLRARPFDFDTNRWALLIHDDITDTRQLLQTLHDGEQWYRSIFVRSTDGLFICDTDGWIRQVNTTACQLYGYTENELVGTNVRDLIHPDHRERCLALFHSLQGREASERVESLDIRKDGSTFDAEVEGAAVDWGGQRRVLAIVRDISDRKRMERQQLDLEARAQAAQRIESLAVLAGGIAHDFNNLLVAVLGNADLALRALSPDDPSRAHLKEIHAAAMRASELTDQMLAYSGKGRFVLKPVDLNALLEEMADVLASTVPATSRLTVTTDDALPPIQTDPTQIRQLIRNLVSNAVEALPSDDGRIIVQTEAVTIDEGRLARRRELDDLPPGRYAALLVIDNGCGMDTRTHARIFDPFFSTKFTGRGLGMAAVLGIVRGHHGTIEIDSDPGAGTTVRVLLPTSREQPRRETSAAVEPETWKGTGTVLVVDDEPSVRKLAVLMLERMGFETLAAADGREAIALCHEHGDRLTAVLLDRTLPTLSGAELVHH